MPDERGMSAVRRLYRGRTQFDFINRWKYWFALSGAVIAVGLVALGVGGLNFSIDFKGGVVWEVPTNVPVATVRAELSPLGHALGQDITQFTNRQTGQKTIEVQAAASLTSEAHLVSTVSVDLAHLAHVKTDAVNVSAIGPSWGSDISSKAIEAVVVFLVLISVCIAAYFETKMAIAALVALLHDMLVTVGIYALSGFQVSPDTVIAFLTVLGYSLYDTIVVFDKVKENTRGLASTNRVTYTDVVNLSMNQVLARSVNTSFVAIMPVFCILVIGSWIMGASALNDFGLALFIGLMSGAYSSIFIASPILAMLKEREPRFVEIRRRLAAYPQSRQILTAAMVADGAVIVGRTGMLRAGGAPEGQVNGGASNGGAVNGGAVNGGSGQKVPSAELGTDVNEPAEVVAAGVLGRALQVQAGQAGSGSDGRSGAGPQAGAVAPRPRGPGAGVPEGGSAGAGAKRPAAARPGVPRARKKAPQRKR